MAEQSFPFENIDTTESQFSEWATNFQETGVQGSPTGTELGITVTGSDLNLTVAAGQAFIRGHYYINTDNLVLAVTSAGTNTRIDIVVVELDPEANTIVTKIVSGEAVAADPVAPTLTQSATGIYQLPISTLTIPTSTVAITAGMLVDTRTFMGNRIGIWTTATRPANPTAYQTLGYNTTIGSHESWNGTSWVGFFDPITTAGDLVVGDDTGQASRLGVGANDQVLTVVSGSPEWADGGGGGNYYNITKSGSYSVDLEAGLYSLASDNPAFVGGISVNGFKLQNFDTAITSVAVINEGITWNLVDAGFSTTGINAVTYGDGLYVAVGGDGTMTTSTDGTTWTTRTSGFGSETIRGVTYGDGLYVAGGDDGTMTTSTDGTTWTTRTSGFGSTRIYGVTYGGGVYVAVGYDGKITSSTDGVTWAARTSQFGTSQVRAVAYGDGMFIATGQNAKISSSPDGTTWTARTSNTEGNVFLFGADYGNGLFFAGGEGGRIVTSPDGITWQRRSNPFSADTIQGAGYGDGLYVMGDTNGTMATSPNGITWTRRTSGFGSTNITDIGYGDGIYAAVGGQGKMTQSKAPITFLSVELKSPVTDLPA